MQALFVRSVAVFKWARAPRSDRGCQRPSPVLPCTAGILSPIPRARRPRDCRRDGGVTEHNENAASLVIVFTPLGFSFLSPRRKDAEALQGVLLCLFAALREHPCSLRRAYFQGRGHRVCKGEGLSVAWRVPNPFKGGRQKLDDIGGNQAQLPLLLDAHLSSDAVDERS